jgi:hypothetical protein
MLSSLHDSVLNINEILDGIPIRDRHRAPSFALCPALAALQGKQGRAGQPCPVTVSDPDFIENAG